MKNLWGTERPFQSSGDQTSKNRVLKGLRLPIQPDIAKIPVELNP